MIPEDYQQILLYYLSNLDGEKHFEAPDDLAKLGSMELLLLIQKVDDEALGPVLHMLKKSSLGREIFEKLMGDHEEENRELVELFFARYMRVVLAEEEKESRYNPLEVYLPASTFDDLAFIQSRQSFFLRQSIQTINDFLKSQTEFCPQFRAGEQEKAWVWFWDFVTAKE